MIGPIGRLAALGMLGLAMAGDAPAADEGFPVASNLKAAAAKVDITPPPDTKVVGHPRKTSGARDPIHAGILLLDDGKTRAAIATFDLINAGDALVKAMRDVIAQATGTPPAHILVAASHNH